MYFLCFVFERAWPFIWTNLNPLHPRILCAKFGWNWPSDSGEEDENVKSLQTDDGRQVIRKAHLSFQLRWAKNCRGLGHSVISNFMISVNKIALYRIWHLLTKLLGGNTNVGLTLVPCIFAANYDSHAQMLNNWWLLYVFLNLSKLLVYSYMLVLEDWTDTPPPL